MEHHHAFLETIEAFCREHGMKPSSLCRRATGDPRRWDRLKNRVGRTEADVITIQATMDAIRAERAPGPDDTTSRPDTRMSKSAGAA